MNKSKLPYLATPVFVAILIAAWDFYVRYSGVSPFVMPSPSAVGSEIVRLLGQADTWRHIIVTATEAFTGFVIAVLLGIVVAIVLARRPWLEQAVNPLIITAQVIPKVALIPLFIVWFGFGMSSKIVIAAAMAFFPVMLNVLLGIKSVERGHRDVMQVLNASRSKTFWRLEFPNALPYVFAGMQVGIVFAVIGAVVGEFLGGSQGLGYLVVASLNALLVPQMFAAIVILAGVGLVFYSVLLIMKRVAIPWHESVQQVETSTT